MTIKRLLRSNNWLVYGANLAILSACTGHVQYVSDKDGDRQNTWKQNLFDQSTSAQKTPMSSLDQGITEIDLQAEEIVSKTCVEAWRTALAGHSEAALKQLKDLQRRYPKMSTVSFMIGQVLERAGKKQEAIPYYKASVRDSEFSSFHIFKLAEAMRTAGDTRGSIPYYRQLLKTSPNFIDGRLGLVKALIATEESKSNHIDNTAEVEGQLKEILKLEPNNKEALKLLEGR